jgi:hypothetical protein
MMQIRRSLPIVAQLGVIVAVSVAVHIIVVVVVAVAVDDIVRAHMRRLVVVRRPDTVQNWVQTKCTTTINNIQSETNVKKNNKKQRHAVQRANARRDRVDFERVRLQMLVQCMRQRNAVHRQSRLVSCDLFLSVTRQKRNER